VRRKSAVGKCLLTAAFAPPSFEVSSTVRQHGRLLGGRAFRYELHGLSAVELADEFDLDRMLNHGYLPRIYQAARAGRMLDAYIGDYLKEEIGAEGLVRSLPTFRIFWRPLRSATESS
jgi:hypothetical protein